MESESRADPSPTSVLALIIAWAVTCGPLAWGVYMTVLGALKLFQS